MRKMTEENLEKAFAGESQAHMRYLIFAEKAEEEGFPNVARLFRAIAYAEQVHAKNHYGTLGLIRESAENLQAAIDGETHEVEEIYPAYSTVAKLQGEKGAQRVMEWALQAEKIHAGMYQKAKQAVESGKDIKMGPIFICKLCGYTVEGEVPDRCPVCGAAKERFQKF
ncbi:MAG: rubrerythrin family protein [Candidatus Bathyarchaeota archaeon]|nr:rubrerythrin family protein [Candidatus Bathyarchaeota archaeon]MCX8177588.1 rubrerythrin family protein [Candidatus Bathyarchaeota archaeon]MDW8194296.1 rubrerythrin family protein [Nitrososphaerota archaeon]